MTFRPILMAAALAAVFSNAALADRLASNGSTVLALRQNGTLVGWGDNSASLFGNSAAELPSSPYPISLSHVANLKSVALGNKHALGLRLDGTVVAWGNNDSGQLGQGSVGSNVAQPVPVAGLNNVIAIAAGSSHNLALRQGGTVWAWGSNQAGQLGDNSLNSYTQPHQIMTLSGVTAIASSGSFNAALLGDGSVWFWGQATSGSYGSTTRSFLPTAIPKLGNIVAIAVAANRIISLGADGSVYEWTPSSYSTTLNSALKVTGLPPATQIAADAFSIYSVSRGDGKIWQSTSNSNKPVTLLNTANVIEITTGLNVALTRNGDLYRWDIINANSYYSTPTYSDPKMVRGIGNEGLLNLNAASPTPADERCQASAAQSGASVYVNVPCVRFNGYNYQMSLQFDPTVTANGGSYFKLLELK